MKKGEYAGRGGDRMLPERRRAARVRRISNVILAAAASAALLTVLSSGYGTTPALGPALDPGHGVWAPASGGPGGPMLSRGPHGGHLAAALNRPVNRPEALP
jgi:hypothetical protein